MRSIGSPDARAALAPSGVLSSFNRGARIRTGDLCDPNAALYRTEPRPVPDLRPGGTDMTVNSTADGVGFEPTRAFAHTISNRAP